jgi:hypothetical protein
MATQADFMKLEQLRLLDHGDAIERFYWPQVSNAISEYEVFWKRFVVLLTNRVNPFAFTGWIMLRDGLPAEYESFLMANYSTFYHCVVSREQIEIGRKAKAEHGFNHPELFFFSAKACLDNLGTMQSEARGLLNKFGAQIRFPKSPTDLIQAITRYRHAFAHRKHLGRGSQHGRDLIPVFGHLPKSDKDPEVPWSYTMSLGESEMTDALDYQTRLWDDLAIYLQGTWKALSEAFVKFRTEPLFIEDVGLESFLPIDSEIANRVIPSQENPVAASGTIIYERKTEVPKRSL